MKPSFQQKDGDKMKIFKYEIEFTNDNDKDYHKTGIVISESKETAGKQVYQHYDKKTTDYVYPGVLLTEMNIIDGLIIEDEI